MQYLVQSRGGNPARDAAYPIDPFPEVKLVRCISGAESMAHLSICGRRRPLYRAWAGFDLSAENHRTLYVPEGFAHGYLTLADHTEVFYQVSECYNPGHERGIRWNDPAFAIHWPATPRIVSPKDASHPDFA